MITTMRTVKMPPEPQCVQSCEARLLIHPSVARFEAVQVWCPHSDDDDNDDHDDDHDAADDDHARHQL